MGYLFSFFCGISGPQSKASGFENLLGNFYFLDTDVSFPICHVETRKKSETLGFLTSSELTIFRLLV